MLIYFDTAIVSLFMDVCETRLYAKYIFLKCYQHKITNHSYVLSLKLLSVTCKTQLTFIDISHLIMTFCFALVTLYIEKKKKKRNCEIKYGSFL